MIICRAFFAGLACLLIGGATAGAQTSDSLVFGNTTSEANHGLTAYFPPPTNIATVTWQNTPAPSNPSATAPSDVVAGLLGLSARRLLPRTPNGDVYGGQVTFTMAVDPAKQNYFTLKLSAADPYGNDCLILNCNGKEIGARHGGNTLSEDMLWSGGSGWWLGRFYYRTEPLPLPMTRGKTSVTITVRSSGSFYAYAPIFTYVPQYQSLMTVPAESLYAAYTHAGSQVDSTGEPEGSAPAVRTPNTLVNETTQLNNVMSSVNAQLASDLQNTPANLSQNDADFLAGCYDALTNAGATYITYPAGMTAATLGAQVVAILDNAVTSYAAGSGIEGSDWGGGLGPMGDAIRLAWPLISGSMSATVAYGGTLGTTTRQMGWATALRASVDAGRYNRQTIGNQALDNGTNIYRENSGCLLVNSAQALSESQALRYPKEACGILPWMGNDLATGGTDGKGGGPTPTQGVAPYGPNWFMCTTKALTKDGDGFVGGDYGEVGPFLYRFGLISGDAQLQARGIAMARARLPFRYPGADSNGYLIMLAPDPIGDRNNNLPGHVDYLGQSNSDDFLMASQGASVIGNDLLGAFQEEIAQGQIYQYFYYLDPYLPQRWAAIKAMAQTNVPLPMTAGQPDFAWADEQDMVVAAKHGEERIFVNLFWRAQPFINGFAKVFQLTPSLARLGDVFEDDVRFRATGQTLTSGGIVDGFATPEDNPVEAFAGTPEPVALRSDLSSPPPTNRDGGRGTGYTLRYGNWLIGIDADYSAAYSVKLPSDFTSAKDLISGQTMSGPVTLQPQTSVVFYLPDTTDPVPTPSASLYLGASGSNGAISLAWLNASAAASYNVLRSTTSGSGYTTIASGLTGTSYRDTAVVNGTTYYYVVTATDSIGSSSYSPEASAAPVAPKTSALPTPWTDVDVGAAVPASSATLVSGTFAVKAGGGTFGGTTEGFHLVYQPMAGDGTLTAKISGETNSSGTNTSTRAGVVLRDSLAQNAEMGAMLLQRNSSSKYTANYQYCGGDNGSIVTAGGPNTLTAPYWVRLARTGLTITGAVSPDGVTWTQVGSYTNSALPYVCYAGLMADLGTVSSSATTTATFTNVTFPLYSTAAPSTPAGVTASASQASVAVAWTPVSSAVSYNIKRGTSSGGPFTTVGSVSAGATFSDYGMPAGTYYYVVSAVNSVGESTNSNAVSILVGGPLPAALTGLSATPASAQVALTWNAAAGATSYQVTRTAVDGTAVVIASGLTATSYTDATPVNGTVYEYGVIPVNANGTGQGAAVIVMPPGGLPTGWQSQDIGEPQLGGTSYASGVYTLSASGTTIFNAADVFRYAYQTVTGNFIYTARVASVANNTSGNYEAGIMVRNTVDAGSAEISLITTSNGGYTAYDRASTGAATGYSGGGGFPTPVWLRMVRVGTTVYLYISADGATWAPAGGYTASLKTAVTVGLALTSESGSVQDVATFDNISLYQNVAVGGTATADSQNSGNGQGAAQAFDGNTNTKWLTIDSGNSGWLQYKFAGGTSQTITQYQIVSASDVPQRDPATWQLLGSNNGTTWTTLDTQTGQTFANRGQANSYVVASPQAFAYYRLNVTANEGGTGYGLQLAELALLVPGTAGPPLAPPAPASLAASWSDGQIALSWAASLGATSYNLKRSTTTGGPYTTIASGLTTLSYTDSGLTDGTTYYYVVTAVNSGGESPNSPEDSATPYAVPAPPTGVSAAPGNAQVTLSWTAVAGANSYNVKRSTSSGGPFTPAKIAGQNVAHGKRATVDIAPSVIAAVAGGNSYTDLSGNIGTTYYYVITAVDLGGESGNSTVVSATPTLLTPTSFAAVAGNKQVVLSWNAQPNASGYNVMRGAVSGGPYASIASPTGTSFTDTGVGNGKTYFYVVSTEAQGQQSANSAQVSATPNVTYAAWQSLYFTSQQVVAGLADPNADANGDGIKNIVAYAFNVSPFANIAGALPVAQVVNGYLTLTFTARTDSTDVTYTVQVSSDLINWYSGANYTTQTSSTPIDADTATVTVSDNVPASPGPRFMRVIIGN
jgi:fibronectin type 3 domain-containing protein